MSLFKTEEFWSTKCGQGETYITSSLCVANFFSNSNDQIITGSMNGYLRLFCPKTKQNTNETLNPDGDNNNPFSIEKSNSLMDITIEYYLKQPIIQLEFGKFCYDSKLSLAVLNPNRLVLLEIDEGTMSFKILEEFNLKRVAYNFCFGNFGRVSERDFICVQATDTTLSFFINGHLSFSCFLMDYLLPGPIQYVAEDDSIIIVNSNRYFQAYKYKNLAVSNSKNSNLSPMKTQKCATPDWEYNLGEDALELKVCDTSEQGSLILILCRYSLFIFNCKSRTAVKKRFETRCRLLICNGTVKGVEPRFLLSNSSNELMVFQNTTLKWKALMINPNVVDMKIGQFDGLKGYIVTLNEIGNLVVLYLGTDPSTNTVLMPSNRDIINENNEEELLRLHRKIKTLTSTNAVQPIAIKTSDLSKSVLLKLQIDYSSGVLKHADNSNLLSPEYSIDIKLKSSTDIRNVTVRVSTRLPIIAKQKLFHYKSITPDNRDNSVCNLHFLSSAAMVVCSLRVVVYVTYELIDTSSNSNNICKISQTSFHLPLNLVVTSCAPVKQAKFKLTFDTTEEIVNLNQIFSEFPTTNKSSSSSSSDEKLSAVAFAFQYYNDGPIVTILASCNTKRYRIQSDHFEAIWLILKELSNRLSQHFGPNFKIKYSEPLPLDSYFLVLDYHFSIRKTLNQFHNLLEERSKQFRAIEKLVLTKTKDKSLTPLQNLDTLLENSINQLVQLSDLIIEQEQHLVIVGNAVSSATSIISYLLQITGGSMSSSSSQQQPKSQQQIIIQNALSGDFRDFPEIGLEELYEEIFVFLLKSVVNNNNNNNNNQSKKEIMKLLSDTKLFELPNNIDKLKKHIELFCERIGNGVQLNVENQFSLSNTKSESNKGKEKKGIEEEEEYDDESGDLMRKFVLTGPTGRNKSSKTNKKSKKKKNLLLE